VEEVVVVVLRLGCKPIRAEAAAAAVLHALDVGALDVRAPAAVPVAPVVVPVAPAVVPAVVPAAVLLVGRGSLPADDCSLPLAAAVRAAGPEEVAVGQSHLAAAHRGVGGEELVAAAGVAACRLQEEEADRSLVVAAGAAQRAAPKHWEEAGALRASAWRPGPAGALRLLQFAVAPTGSLRLQPAVPFAVARPQQLGVAGQRRTGCWCLRETAYVRRRFAGGHTASSTR
jgi:hypothetical protein